MATPKYSFKEKNKHYTDLLSAEAAEADLVLLTKAQGENHFIVTSRRSPARYASEILFKLLDHHTQEDIRLHRREFFNTEENGTQGTQGNDNGADAPGTNQGGTDAGNESLTSTNTEGDGTSTTVDGESDGTTKDELNAFEVDAQITEQQALIAAEQARLEAEQKAAELEDEKEELESELGDTQANLEATEEELEAVKEELEAEKKNLKKVPTKKAAPNKKKKNTRK